MKETIKFIEEKYRKNGFFNNIYYLFRFLSHLVIYRIEYLFAKVSRRNKMFKFNNKDLPYFKHIYNIAYANERSVEVPIILSEIENCKKGKILELGNVLQHYVPISHVVVDKYEKGKNVTNVDVVTFKPKIKFDLIVSISTLEHVGHDEVPKDDEKIWIAIDHMKNMLAKDGKLVVTLPVGYHPLIDERLKNNKLPFQKIFYLKKLTKYNDWMECDRQDIVGAKYGFPYPGVNALMICYYQNR